MGDRREPRAPTRLPVKVSGVDAEGNAFTQTAYARDVSRAGARLEGIECLTGAGQSLTIEHRGQIGRFRVAWVGQPGTTEQGRAGVKNLEPRNNIWKIGLPQPAPDRCIPSRHLADTAQKLPAERSKRESTGHAGQASPSRAERRQHRRATCPGKIEFSIEGSHTLNQAKLTDLSLGGCYAEFWQPCKVGTKLMLRLSLGGLPLQVSGVVKVVHPGFGMGIEFSGISDQDRARLQESLSLSAAGVPK